MSTPPLPQSLEQCQQLLWVAYQQNRQLEQDLAQAKQQTEELNRVLEDTAQEFEKLRQTHATTLEELATLKRHLYGRRRERSSEGEGQQYLFDFVESSPPPSVSDPEPSQQTNTSPRSRRNRKQDLSHLPHIRHEEDLSEEEKVCSCCHRTKDRIGEDVSTVWEYVPAKLEIHEHVRPKYACRHCKDGVSSPPVPPRPIPRSPAGPGLLAQILVSKFGDHLPLYRQEDILVRHGLHLSRSTQCDWMAAVAQRLKPLYVLQRDRVRQSEVLWTDDTTVTVLVGGEKGSCKGRFWTYIAEEYPYSVYDFTMSRSRDGPQLFLKDFRGYLHADAYAGYDAIYLNSDQAIVEVACWAHARRKFYDVRNHAPREVYQVLEWVRQLYDLEDRACDLTVQARLELRRREAIPVLDKLEAYLNQLAQTMLPKSSLAKAVNYARNQWKALRCYTNDGRLSIDNNTSERTLRSQAVGRKNWLFLGSPQAGPNAAILYTIVAGAKRHHLEPWAYVKDVLSQIAAGEPDWEGLLPDRWATLHPEFVLSYRLEEARQKAQRQRDRRQRRRSQSTS